MVQNALKGRAIAITRPREQAEETGKLIRKYGGKPYFIPTIEIRGTSDSASIKNFITELEKGKIDYVLFMSINGIRYLLSSAERLEMKSQLKEYLGKTVTVAVGPKTAQELRTHSIPANLVPAKYSSEGIIECLQQRNISGKSIYIPRTRGATPVLANKLREMGGEIKEICVYESLIPTNKELTVKFFQDLIDGEIHAIIFGSSMSAKNLFKMLKELVSMEKLRELMNSRLTIVAIGPVTAETLSELGLRVDIMPDRYLFEEALIALARYWNAK